MTADARRTSQRVIHCVVPSFSAEILSFAGSSFTRRAIR